MGGRPHHCCIIHGRVRPGVGSSGSLISDLPRPLLNRLFRIEGYVLAFGQTERNLRSKMQSVCPRRQVLTTPFPIPKLNHIHHPPLLHTRHPAMAPEPTAPPPYTPSSAPPPPTPPALPDGPNPISGIEFACNAACAFYSLLAVVAHDRISRDGKVEALALADCMKMCKDRFGSPKK